jgi:hypothetical protein
MSDLQIPLSAQQLEILSIFNNKAITEQDWKELKELIAAFFAKKSLGLASDAWDRLKWTDETMDNLLNQHLRTSYNPNNQPG